MTVTQVNLLHDGSRATPAGRAPLVSVIVPVRNAREKIADFLAALKAQTYPRRRFEIVVVDNASEDGTARAAEAAGVRVLRCDDTVNPYAARNLGIRESSGAILALLDVNCMPAPHWLAEAVVALDSAKADLVGGNTSFVLSDRPTRAEMCDAVTNVDVEATIGQGGFCAGGNLVFSRAVYDALGPFPEDARSGADVRWTARATERGFRLVFARRAVAYYRARRLGALLAKSFRVGRGQARFWRERRRSLWAAFARHLLPPTPRTLRAAIERRGTPEMRRRFAGLWLVAWLHRLARAAGQLAGMLPGFVVPRGTARSAEEQLETRHLQADLAGRAVRGGAVTVAAQAARFALQALSIVLLARLLTPVDFGLVAMVTAVTGLLELVKDLGLSTATIQREKITHRQVSTLFWINVAVSVLLMLLVALGSPALAAFYGEPRLAPIALVLAATFLLGGLTVQHQAILRRQMRFKVLARIDLTSFAAGVAAAVFLAWADAGYWALVALPVVSVITSALLVWDACDWRPGPPDFRCGLRPLLGFGGNLTGSRIVHYCNRNLDKVLLGKVWGGVALGLYAKAYRLVLLPASQLNAPLGNVIVPTLSRLKSEPARYREAYVAAVRATVALGMPVVAFAVATADLWIVGLLGVRWAGAVPLFRALGVAAFLATFNAANGWVLISLGRTGRQLRWSLVNGAVILAAYLGGLPFGAVGVAWAASLASVALRLPATLYCFSGTPLRLRDLVRALAAPAAASLGAAVLLVGFRWALPAGGSRLGAFLICLPLYGATYLALLLPTGAGRAAYRTARSLLAALRKSPS